VLLADLITSVKENNTLLNISIYLDKLLPSGEH
jgi:hypothetical protein